MGGHLPSCRRQRAWFRCFRGRAGLSCTHDSEGWCCVRRGTRSSGTPRECEDRCVSKQGKQVQGRRYERRGQSGDAILCTLGCVFGQEKAYSRPANSEQRTANSTRRTAHDGLHEPPTACCANQTSHVMMNWRLTPWQAMTGHKTAGWLSWIDTQLTSCSFFLLVLLPPPLSLSFTPLRRDISVAPTAAAARNGAC